MVKDLELVPGVIRKGNGYKFDKEFIDSLEAPVFSLFDIGIIRFDNGEFNSYYIKCLSDDLYWGLAKFNKDHSFNSLYVQKEEEWEDRFDEYGKLICRYKVEGNGCIYTKSTDGSIYYIDGKKDGFKQGNKQYYYIR